MSLRMGPDVISPVFWRLRPFFDLGPAPDQSPLVAHSPGLAYRLLDDGESVGPQYLLGEAFRAALLRESGLRGYSFMSPAGVDRSLRTNEWERVCELIDHFSDLRIDSKVRLCRLLSVLGFHRLVLSLIPEDVDSIQDLGDRVSLAYAREFCAYVLRRDAGDAEASVGLKELLVAAPEGSRLQFSLAMTLLVDSAKTRRSVDIVRAYRRLAEQALSVGHLRTNRDEFAQAVLEARFYRGASFVPFLAGDGEQTSRELALAETTALHAAAIANGTDQQLVARELLFFVVESRMREAQWLGKRELWLARARALVELMPSDPKARIEYGEALLANDSLALAEREYTVAARLGPPGTAIALFSAGQCRERLGDLEGACDAYYRAVHVDPYGSSSVDGLRRVAKRLGDGALHAWADRRLAEHQPSGAAGPRTGRTGHGSPAKERAASP